MSTIAETLQGDYDAFINQPQPFGFFSGLSDYVGYVLRTEQLKTIVDAAMQEKQKLLDEYDQLQKQTLKEMKVSEKKIRKIIKDNNIDPASITMVFTSGPNTRETLNLLERLEEFDRSHPGHGSRKWRTYGDYLFDITVNLSKKGYGEQLKELTVSADEWGRYYEDPYPEDNTSGLVLAGNINGNFVFSKTEPLIYKQDARMDKESQYGALWSVFDHLLKLHEAFSARSQGMSEYDFLNDYNQRHPARNEVEANDMWEVNLAFDDLAVLNLSNEERKGYVPPQAVRPHTQFLRVDEFKGLASRAHRHLLKELARTKADEAMLDNQTVRQKKQVETPILRSKPRLLVEKDKSGLDAGYLQLSPRSPKLRVAEVDSRKFKLVICLFSPEAAIKSSYAPTLQSYERVFEKIGRPEDKFNERLKNDLTRKDEMLLIIKTTVKEIRRSEEMKKHLDVVWQGDKLQLNIKP